MQLISFSKRDTMKHKCVCECGLDIAQQDWRDTGTAVVVSVVMVMPAHTQVELYSATQ